MATSKSQRPYTGVLAEPMEWEGPPSSSILSLKEDSATPKAQNLKAFGERVIALAKHYGRDLSDPEAGFALAMDLAFAHVPGFQIKGSRKRPGKPTEWDTLTDSRLYADVQTATASGKTVAKACADLVKRGAAYEGEKAATLAKRYRTVIKNKSALQLMLPQMPAAIMVKANKEATKLFPAISQHPSRLNKRTRSKRTSFL